MKATKMTLIAALALGSLLAMSPASRADDSSTNTTPSTPPAGAPHHGPRGPGMRGPNVDRLAERLALTEDQKPKVKAIFEDQQKQMHALWQDQSLSREDRMTKMRSIHQDTLAQLKNVLTADQYQKFQDMRPKMGGPRHRPPGGANSNDGGQNPPAGAPPQS